MVIKNIFKTIKIMLVILILLLLGCKIPVPVCPKEKDNQLYVVVPDDFANIQDAINSLPNNGGTVFIKAGNYIITESIHINKSNVTLKGEQGTYLKLDDHINQPVIRVGTDKEIPVYPTDSIKNINILNIEIDGNKTNQDAEEDVKRKWIMNNGIDVRMVDNLYIANVKANNTRSGGIVTSWWCHRIIIENVYCYENYFDGIALNASEDVIITNFFCYENNAAGLSMDNQIKRASFSIGIIRNNEDVGIFVRNSEDLHFNNLIVHSNGSHGCFLSHWEDSPETTGVKRLFFSNCSFLNNSGYGVWLASTQQYSPDNVVASSLFSGNALGQINGPIDSVNNIFQ